MKRPSLLLALCVLPWAMVVAGLSWLLIQRFPPSGRVTFDVPFDGRSAWINPFLPSERVTPPGVQADGWRGQRILQDPVYTSARVPGVYDRVDVGIEFRPVRQPLVELGAIRNLAAGEIEFSPLWFAPLQDASWKEESDVGFRRVDAKTTDTRTTAVWHASSTMPALSDVAMPMQTTRVTIRGGHDIYAVPADGVVTFRFAIQDANRSSGGDTVIFRLFRGTEQIGSDALGIGGTQDAAMGPVLNKTITIPHASPGVYRIQIIMDDDVFIRSIATTARHWVLGPRLVFGDDVGYATSTRPGIAWSDSRHLVLETFHHEGLQRVTFGSDGVSIIKTHEPYPLDRTDQETTPVLLNAPDGDMRIIGDGWFSFSADAWFAPQPRHITDATDPAAEGITRVLTPYERPEDLGGGWYRAHASFALDPAQDVFRMALSAPGLLTRSGAVDIRRVTLTYQRPSLYGDEWWYVIRQEAVNAWRRLRSSL
jgi:hypothetical protein